MRVHTHVVKGGKRIILLLEVCIARAQSRVLVVDVDRPARIIWRGAGLCLEALGPCMTISVSRPRCDDHGSQVSVHHMASAGGINVGRMSRAHACSVSMRCGRWRCARETYPGHLELQHVRAEQESLRPSRTPGSTRLSGPPACRGQAPFRRGLRQSCILCHASTCAPAWAAMCLSAATMWRGLGEARHCRRRSASCAGYDGLS